MPKINIEKQSSLSPQESYAKLKTMLDTDPDLKRLDSNYKCQFDDARLAGTAKGKMFDADMTVKPEGGGACKVTLVVTLPLIASPFKGTVEATLKKKLDRILG